MQKYVILHKSGEKENCKGGMVKKSNTTHKSYKMAAKHPLDFPVRNC